MALQALTATRSDPDASGLIRIKQFLSWRENATSDSGKRAPFQIKEGDRVLFTSYAGNEVTVDGEELLIMTEDDILAVVE